MKTIAPAAMAAIENGTARLAAAIEIASADPVRAWSGLGVLPFEGNEYLPLGDQTIGIATGATIGGIAQNTTLTLAGLDPELLTLLDPAEIKGAPVTVWSLVFDTSGTILLDSFVHRRGRVDRVPVRETSGGTATISVEVESPGKGLGRRTGRMRADADQRLIDASDGGMRLVSFAAAKTLYWGGRRPATAGSALGGNRPGGRLSPWKSINRD